MIVGYDHFTSARAGLGSLLLAARRKDLQPTLTAQIEYRMWTGDGKLLHASYKVL
jgi:hypothetical protein